MRKSSGIWPVATEVSSRRACAFGYKRISRRKSGRSEKSMESDLKTILSKSVLLAPVTDAEFHHRAVRNFWLAAVMAATAMLAAILVFSPH